jgi:hypothetical protein
MVISGEWRIVVRYAFIDVGTGTLINSLTVRPDIITKYYVSNTGSNVIDGDASLILSFKLNNYFPKDS